MKRISILGVVFLSVIFVLSSCQKQPSASFSASSGSVNVDESIIFTNTSIDGDSYSWDFGDGGTSYELSPTHSYSKGGTYSVKLTAYSKNGKKTSESSLSITVKNIVTFNNNVFTDISITVGSETKTVSPGKSVTFTGVADKVAYTAKTSGTTSSGTIIGLEMTWNNTVDLANANTFNLVITNDYFFLYIKNTGSKELTDLYVNYGLAHETYDDVVIPNDGKTYSTGYYNAFSNSNVYCLLGSQTVYWDPITLPNTENQSITLTNNNKKGSDRLLVKKSFNPLKLNVVNADFLLFDNNEGVNEYCN